MLNNLLQLEVHLSVLFFKKNILLLCLMSAKSFLVFIFIQKIKKRIQLEKKNILFFHNNKTDDMFVVLMYICLVDFLVSPRSSVGPERRTYTQY